MNLHLTRLIEIPLKFRKMEKYIEQTIPSFFIVSKEGSRHDKIQEGLYRSSFINESIEYVHLLGEFENAGSLFGEVLLYYIGETLVITKK